MFRRKSVLVPNRGKYIPITGRSIGVPALGDNPLLGAWLMVHALLILLYLRTRLSLRCKIMMILVRLLTFRGLLLLMIRQSLNRPLPLSLKDISRLLTLLTCGVRRSKKYFGFPLGMWREVVLSHVLLMQNMGVGLSLFRWGQILCPLCRTCGIRRLLLSINYWVFNPWPCFDIIVRDLLEVTL